MDDRGSKLEDEFGENVLIVDAEAETPADQAEHADKIDCRRGL